MAILLPLFVCLCLTQVADAIHQSRNLASLTWRNSLSSRAEMEQFLSGSERMVRETITMGLSNVTIVLGSDPLGDLSLLEFLQVVQKQPRKQYGAVLVITGVHLYTMALPIFQQFEGSGWITLAFQITRGPNGVKPPIIAEALSLALMGSPLPRGFHVCMEMTTGDVGPEKGYTQANIFEFLNAIKAVPLGMEFETVWDAYHISYTPELDLSWMPFLGFMEIIYFQCSAKMQDKVDLAVFMEIFNKFSQSKMYLNMPRALQEKILNYNKRNRASQATMSFNLGGLCFIVFLGLLGKMMEEGVIN